MVVKLKRWVLCRPEEGGEGGAAAGVVDRGDDFTPTGDDAPENTSAKPSAEDAAAAAALEAELAAKKDKPAAEGEKPAGLAAGKPEVETDPEGGEKAKSIPLSRHKSVLEAERMRRETLEAELAQYKQGGKVADMNAEITKAEDDLVALEKEHAKLIADNEYEKAAGVMTQIRRAERAINQRTAEMREQAAEMRAVERVRLDTTIERIEEQYPVLNVDHESYDQEKTAEVLQLKSAYEKLGFTPSAALQKAVKILMPPKTVAQKDAVEIEPRVKAAEVEAARKAAAAKATADAVAGTPANTANVGKDSDTAGGAGDKAMTAKDAMKLPYERFIKLGEDDLARMRGDLV